MTVTCPYCATEMKSDGDLVKGQNVICPCCKLKFAYSEENDVNSYYEAKFWSFVGRLHWSLWHKRLNGIILKALPGVTALMAGVACMIWLVTLARQDAPVSAIFRPWLVLMAMMLSVHLSRKAMTLPCKLIAKCERLVIRPQYAYILKVAVGAILIIVGGNIAIGDPTRDRIVVGIAVALVGIAWSICMESTSIMRIRVGTPANGVDEAVALLALPLRFIAALLPIATALTLVGGAIYACVEFKDSGEIVATALSALTVLPFAVSLFYYIVHVCVMLGLDFLKAVAAIPATMISLQCKK